MSQSVLLLHYNDVYNVESGPENKKDARVAVGGAARFATLVEKFRAESPLVLFSGDAFNPSAMSTVTKGKHLVPVLNALKTNVAVMGVRRPRARARALPRAPASSTRVRTRAAARSPCRTAHLNLLRRPLSPRRAEPRPRLWPRKLPRADEADDVPVAALERL